MIGRLQSQSKLNQPCTTLPSERRTPMAFVCSKVSAILCYWLFTSLKYNLDSKHTILFFKVWCMWKASDSDGIHISNLLKDRHVRSQNVQIEKLDIMVKVSWRKWSVAIKKRNNFGTMNCWALEARRMLTLIIQVSVLGILNNHNLSLKRCVDRNKWERNSTISQCYFFLHHWIVVICAHGTRQELGIL